MGARKARRMPIKRRTRFVPWAVAALAGIVPVAVLLGAAGCSSSSSSPISHPPPPTPTAKFAYTANEKSANLSGFAVDPSTGVLTPLAGFPIASGTNPIFAIHDPLNQFVIVADIATNLVRVYGINSSTGMLTEVPPSPYVVGQEPRQLAIDPTGKFVYVASQSVNNVAAFSMSTSGVLTPVPGSPFATGGTGPSFGCCVVVDPSGKFVYIADTTSVYAFDIDSSTGALTLVTTLPGPVEAGGLAVDPAGTFLYAVGAGSNSVDTFAINPSTGAITPATPSPLELQNGSYTITIDPSGKFAYTVEASQTLVAYSLQDGVLTGLNSGYTGALGSLQLTIDPSGSFIYAPQTGSENSVSGFQIGASGTLSALPDSPTATGEWPFSMTITSQ
jgi:6-phosphogluconolactonase (cycloisomerase 2 family)